jgi:hypothetical protein
MKDCLIIGPATALMYKDVYPLLVSKKLKLGHKGHMERIGFYYTGPDGNSVFMTAIWLTTLQVERKDKFIPTEVYSPEKYPYYDGTDIIEVKPYNKLPKDYDGKMGVPIGFFFYYPELDYEILEKRGDLKLNGKNKFARLIIRRKQL